MKNFNPNYDKISFKTWLNNDLQTKDLKLSIELFDFKKKKITPKKLEVIALLSGLPFSKKLSEKIVSIQNNIEEIIGNRKHYWVKKNNLGIEYCVFKWPKQKLKKTEINILLDFVKKIKFKSFNVLFDGCQLNPDGCIVVKGYDTEKVIIKLRKNISKNINFLPSKQSKWFHIPIGRILEPVGKENFLKLKKFFLKNSNGWRHYEEINNIKLINEYQWYMEKRKTLLKLKNDVR